MTNGVHEQTNSPREEKEAKILGGKIRTLFGRFELAGPEGGRRRTLLGPFFSPTNPKSRLQYSATRISRHAYTARSRESQVWGNANFSSRFQRLVTRLGRRSYALATALPKRYRPRNLGTKMFGGNTRRPETRALGEISRREGLQKEKRKGRDAPEMRGRMHRITPRAT